MHTLKLHSVSFGEALASHANAQTHSVSCKLRQSTTLEAGKRTGVKTEGKKKKRKICEEAGLLTRSITNSSPKVTGHYQRDSFQSVLKRITKR